MRNALILAFTLSLLHFFAGSNFPVEPDSVQATQQQLSSSGEQTPKVPQPFRLEEGTPIKLRLQRTISSADAQVDDRVDFDVLEEVKVDDVLVIPKGSVACGTVTEAQPKRRMARGGKLNVNIDDVRLADGEKCPLRSVKDVKGGGHTGAMTGGIVATGIVFFPAAPFFLFMHGKDITIPKGTEITAYISGDMPLDRAKFTTQSSVQPQPPAAVSGQPGSLTGTAASHPSDNQFSTIEIKSSPEDAEITVDSKFVGNTPSTLQMTPGDHTVSIEKSGFKPWQRTITCSSGGNVTINAILEKMP